MNILKATLVVAFAIIFTGCAHNITTTRPVVSDSPSGFNGASLHREKIKSIILCEGRLSKNDKEIDIEMFNLLTERAIFDNINKFSRGTVSTIENASIIVKKIEVSGNHPALSFGDNIGLGLLSFILPPLAAIKGKMDYPVSVYVEFSDKDNKPKPGELIEFTVQGTYWGWYVGRPLAARALLVAEEKFVEEAIAIAVVNAAYEKYPGVASPK